MMRAATVVSALVALAASAAEAQTVEVLTGEHGAFTRLALVLPPAAAWTVAGEAGDYTLRIDRTGVLLDASRAFSRIDRARIAALDPVDDGSGVQITLNCDCPLQAYEDPPGILVIDVRDGPPREQSPSQSVDAQVGGMPIRNPRRGLLPVAPVPSAQAVEPALPRFSADAPQWQFDALDQLTSEAPAPVPAPVAPDPQSLGIAISSTSAVESSPQKPLVPADARPLPGPEDLAALQEAETALLRQVARAAAQGLVDPRQPRRDGSMDGAVEVGSTAVFEEQMSVNARTSLDRELGLMAEALRSGAGQRCLTEDAWAVADWGDFRPAVTQLAEARSRLVGEFDRPEPDAILALARLYLHLGFGAEAEQVLHSFPIDIAQAEQLSSLAEIMDNGVAPGATDLHILTECDTGAALWAVLARPKLTPGDAINRDRILRDFAILPPHLRQHLGPPLSERFMGAGDAQAARTIRDAIRRIDAPPTPSVALLDARVDLAGGAVAEAEAQLQAVASGTSPDAAEALALLIEERLARGQPVDAATAGHAAAMAFERSGSPVADRLTRGHARALASLGDFDAAMAAFARMDRAAQTEVLPHLLAELTRAASDTSFLIHVFAQRDRLDVALPPAQRLALSARLLDLGFPAESRLLLAAATPGPEAALQRGRAALMRDEPRAALREIAGRTDPAAEALRGAALLHLGQPLQAAEAYLAAGQEAQAASAAWRAGDLAMAQRLADPERGAAIGTLSMRPVVVDSADPTDADDTANADAAEDVAADVEAPDDAADPSGPLATARTLLEQSAGTRAAVDALLATFPAP